MIIQRTNPFELTPKWELAQRLTKGAKAPEQAVRTVFDGIISGLEDVTKTKFESTLKDRVWSKASAENLRAINEHFITEFCKQIFGIIKDTDIDKMLVEHKKTGSIHSPFLSGQIQTAYQLNYTTIVGAVVEKAQSMATPWVPEIVDLMKKEGIVFPEPKTNVEKDSQ